MTEMGFRRKDSEGPIQKHIDYSLNLNWGSKFIKKYNDEMNRTMTLRVVESVKGESYYFEFSFCYGMNQGNPSIYERMNFFSSPVDPNQDLDQFRKEFKIAYWQFLQLQRRLDSSLNSQENFSAFNPQKRL